MRKIKRPNKSKSFSLQVWLYRIWISFWAVIIAALLGFIFWAYYSGFAEKKWQVLTDSIHNALSDAGFVLDDILIDGRIRTPMEDIRSALNIQSNQLITRLDMQTMQENLQKLPWIKQAVVMRQLPNVLYIQLIERKPIALWQENKKHYPLDEEGYIVNTKCLDCAYLPVVVGNSAPQKTPEFIATLEKFEMLYERVISAVLVDDRRWNLYIDDIDDGMLILLPDTDLKQAFERLTELQEKHQVLDKQIKKLDLRLSDKTVIEPKTKDAIILPDKEDK